MNSLQAVMSPFDSLMVSTMVLVPLLTLAICIREVIALARRKEAKAIPIWLAAIVALATMPYVVQFPAGFLMTVSLPVATSTQNLLLLTVPIVLAALVLRYLPFSGEESEQSKRIIVIVICLVPFVFALVDILMFGVRQFPSVTQLLIAEPHVKSVSDGLWSMMSSRNV